MDKKTLIKLIYSETGRSKEDIEIILDTFFSKIIDSLINNQKITIHGFGSFYCKLRKEKKGRDISKNKTIIIPKSYVPSFKASKGFVEKIKSIEL